MTEPAFDPGAYWEDRLAANPNLHGVGYMSLGESYNSWMYRVRAHVFDRCLSELPVDLTRSRVLDAGSGTGFYVDRWLRAGVANLTAVDLTRSATELLEKRFPTVRVCTADVGDATEPGAVPVESNSLDVVSCMDVLFHIVDDERYATALRNFATWLKPGGFLIMSDNCVHGPEIRLEHHVSRSLERIEALLRSAGLEITQRAPMLYLMNAPVDGSPRRLELWQRAIGRMTRTERAGWVVGAVLYPLERLLVRWRDESPSTELLVCRRVA